MLHVVARYGDEVAGGAESACRATCEHLVERGHEVEVFTSCATSHLGWADVYPPGRSVLRGVTVHRRGARQLRDPQRFYALSQRVLATWVAPPYHLQHRFIYEQGPVIDGLEHWLRGSGPRFDAAVFHTYLYAPTLFGLPTLAGRLPTLVHPSAHDEPPFWLPILDQLLPLADGVMFHTPEEESLYRKRFPRLRAATAVVGLGIDQDSTENDIDGFRRRYGLGDDPYLVVLGRVDVQKGTPEAIAYVQTYRERRSSRVRLVVMGEHGGEPDTGGGVVFTGFVDEATKGTALAGAVALIAPSYFESFSLAAAEAWSHGTPVLAQGSSDVLAGQLRRSSGGLAYAGYAAFEACLEGMLDRPDLRHRMGAAGRRYVDANYRWPVVLDRYEDLVRRTVARASASSRASSNTAPHPT